MLKMSLSQHMSRGKQSLGVSPPVYQEWWGLCGQVTQLPSALCVSV